MSRPIVEYRLEPDGNWLVCLGRDDETAAEVATFLVTHHGALETRPRDGAVTANGAGFRGCLECGGDFWAKRRDARYCCAGCRQRASRSRRRDLATPPTTSGAGITLADLVDGADLGEAPDFDPRDVFGTIHATSRTAVKASASTRATRSGGSSRTRTNRNGETR